MEEDIKLLEEMKTNCRKKDSEKCYIDEKAERKAQAIENLIKGYKKRYRNKQIK